MLSFGAHDRRVVLSIYTLALFACAIELLTFGRGTRLQKMFDSARSRIDRFVDAVGADRCVFIALAALVGLFFAQMHVVAAYVHSATSEKDYDGWTLLFDATDVVLLVVLYVSLSRSARRGLVWPALVVAAVVMYGFAIATRVVATSDLYAYIAYAKLGWQAYEPPQIPFTGAFAPLNSAIALAWVHLEPAPYGPLFLGLARLVAGPATSIVQAIVNLRLLALGGLVLSVVSLRALGFGLPLLAVVALDPQFVGNYLFDAHNDGLAVAAILAALAIAKRSRIAAVVFAVAAGAIKAPYVLPALLVAAGESTLARRFAMAALVAGGTIAVSLIGGRPYFDALFFHGVEHGVVDFSLVSRTLHALAAATAIVATVAVLCVRRTLFTAAWTFPALAAQSLRWYASLGIPYAVLERRHTPIYFILFPISSYLMNEYTTHPYPRLIMLAVVLGIGAFAFINTNDKRRRRADTSMPPGA